MLRRSALVIAILLAALLLWLGAGSGEPAAPALHSAAAAPAPELQPAPPLPPQPARAGFGAGASRDPAVAAEAAPPVDTGMLRGLVLDPEGEPLADAAISVIQERPEGAGRQARWTRTNADGYFEIPSIPPGIWSLRLARRGPRLTQAECCQGEVAIHAGQTSWMDVALAGTRTLTGRFLVPGEDGLGLALVLRAADPPQREAGAAMAVMSAELDQAEAGEEANPAEALSGEFWFWGLAPGRYQLDVYLDLSRRHCVSRAVDLRAGDGDLGTEVLRWEDFFTGAPR